LEYLQRKAATASAGKIQPCFVVYPEMDVSKPLTLSLSGVPLAEALRYCGDLVGGEFVVDRYAISLKRKEVPGKEKAPSPFVLVR
jgi:hypothetical protein